MNKKNLYLIIIFILLIMPSFVFSNIKTYKPKIIIKKEMKMIGLEQKVVIGDIQAIIALWNKLIPRYGEIKNRVNIFTAIGVYQITNDSTYTVFVGVEVKNFNYISEGMVTKTISKQKYAVFTHTGNSFTMQNTYNYIYNEWLVNSDYIQENTQAMEVYGKLWKGANNSKSEMTIYIPVKKSDLKLQKGNNIQSNKSIFIDTMIEMTWEEVKNSAKNQDIVLFPIGVVEEHGPHMNLSPDIYLAYLECKLIKNKLKEKGINAVIAPVYYWGINYNTAIFPGSFTVKPETFKAIMYDIIECLKLWGYKNIFCVNCHGDPIHLSVLESALNNIRKKLDIDAYNIENIPVDIKNPVYLISKEDKYQPDLHAGADETAFMWNFFPNEVNVKRVKKLRPQSNFKPLGYIGDPASYELEKNSKKNMMIYIDYISLKIEAFIKNKKK